MSESKSIFQKNPIFQIHFPMLRLIQAALPSSVIIKSLIGNRFPHQCFYLAHMSQTFHFPSPSSFLFEGGCVWCLQAIKSNFA